MMKKILTSVLFLLSGTIIYAQNTSNQISKNYKIYAGVNYLSNYIYNGRADSLKMSYIIPSITYEADNGLTLNSEIFLLSNGVDNGFDFMEINGLYEFDIYKDLSGGINGTKFISNGSSESFIGNLNFLVGGYLNQKIGPLDLVGGLDILRGTNRTDFRLSPGIESTIEWDAKNFHFKINPSAYAIFSTLHYFESYSNSKKITRARRGAAASSLSTTNNSIVENPGLTFMTYEISMPLTIESASYGISFIPTLALPRNPIVMKDISTTTLNNKIINNTSTDYIPYSELNLRNLFFGQVNLYLKF